MGVEQRCDSLMGATLRGRREGAQPGVQRTQQPMVREQAPHKLLLGE